MEERGRGRETGGGGETGDGGREGGEEGRRKLLTTPRQKSWVSGSLRCGKAFFFLHTFV